MTYAIIGSGAIGSAIATQFARAALDVKVANSRGPATIAPLVARLGDRIQPATLADALDADIVFLAIPFQAVLPAVLAAGDWNGRIVVDATNAIAFPSFKPLDLGGRPSSQLIAETVPGARLVKAFNTLPAAVLAADPRSNGGQRVLFVSGDSAEANQTIATLIADLGFSPIVLGPLHEGGRLQQFGAVLVAQNLSRYG